MLGSAHNPYSPQLLGASFSARVPKEIAAASLGAMSLCARGLIRAGDWVAIPLALTTWAAVIVCLICRCPLGVFANEYQSRCWKGRRSRKNQRATAHCLKPVNTQTAAVGQSYSKACLLTRTAKRPLFILTINNRVKGMSPEIESSALGWICLRMD